MKLLKDYTMPDFEIEQVNLRIELKEKNTLVHSELVMKRNEGLNRLVLEGEEQVLVSVVLNEQTLFPPEYEVTPTQLIIFSVPDVFTLKITSIIQPQNNTALSGLYRSNKLFCTQCEAEGFRRITYYLDRPDVMSLFTTTLVADQIQYPILLSNGNKVAQGTLDNGLHWVKWHDPFKKPAYLFAVVAGRLDFIQDYYITKSNRTIELVIYVPLTCDKQHCEFAMDALKKAMHWDEQIYGLEYDLDSYMIVAVDDFNMGAMENKGLNIFNTQYVLADKKIATDSDFEGVLRVIGHEYFHNWTGNRVTLRDWFQLSLKEGLTVFREQQFFAQYSPIVSRIQNVRLLRTRQFAEDSGPLVHPVRPSCYIEIDNFYTATVYEKGAEVVRMLHTLLGQSKFKKGLDLYFKRHDGQAVTIEDFLSAFSAANEIDLTQFKRWYVQSGTPQVFVTSSYDAQTQVFSLTCRQTCEPTPDGSPKEPWEIPIALQLMSTEGTVLNLTSKENKTILIFNQAVQTFTFNAIPTAPIPSLLGHFSAPVKLFYAYSDLELATLIAYDPDLFNRWDAGIQLFIRCIKHQTSVDILIHALSLVLADTLKGQIEDRAFVSELLSFPSFSYLVEELDGHPHSINITELLEHRRDLIAEIVDKLSPLLIKLYELSIEDNHDARVLKNRCLYLISESAKPELQTLAMQWAVKQYATADNMSDQMGALEVIKNDLGPQRTVLLADFYDRYQSYPLVVNKWLGLHARSKIPTVLENIKALMKHPAFNILTPNQNYALIGGFERGNPDYFHEGTKGYDFLADCIIQIDPKNSSVSAHLANGLLFWKRWTEPQASYIKKALEKVKQQPILSSALSEVVEKALHE